jgi:hypothetical protein
MGPRVSAAEVPPTQSLSETTNFKKEKSRTENDLILDHEMYPGEPSGVLSRVTQGIVMMNRVMLAAGAETSGRERPMILDPESLGVRWVVRAASLGGGKVLLNANHAVPNGIMICTKGRVTGRVELEGCASVIAELPTKKTVRTLTRTLWCAEAELTTPILCPARELHRNLR